MNNNYTFIEKAKNLYWSFDLPGKDLTIPLKRYHGYMVNKVENASGITKIAHFIVHIASGIFAYPIFGLLAALGMLVNLAGIKKLSIESERAIEALEMHFFTQPLDPTYENSYGIVVVNNNFQIEKNSSLNIHCTFDVDPTDPDDMTEEVKERSLKPIRDEIETLTKQYRRVYVQAKGNWQKGSTIYLTLYQSRLLYCVRKEWDKPIEYQGFKYHQAKPSSPLANCTKLIVRSPVYS
ncbi:MAG: hypothetical protein ACHQUC_04660 [Chlamydiales bacterium]